MLLSAITGLFGRDGKHSAEELALLAKAGDEEALNELLQSYAPFVKKTAAQVCKRFIDQHDDEWSIALSAFHEAVKGYEKDKNASFLTFAHLIIRRRVIDFIRKESNRSEFSHDFQVQIDSDETNHWIEADAAIKHYDVKKQAEIRKEEIHLYEQMLAEYKLSFQVLAKVSPAHEDARKTAVQIAQMIAETEEYFDYLCEKKKLPIKEIEQHVKVSRKTIERNRKYIIAIIVLIKSDLHYLKDYLKERLL
ncbi:RNA polymerase sigma-I factor [Planococcus sp. NCCP-2050]|uniref:RNA polymerase sigma-I factor n=1 Tax=Planococcus sp. NCCP-2050 TaxID=2944679 RepID=UPI00203B29D3|nr:RNA polymerase sigma-I factor [Planococcus sp. NCCP-2050]GKW45051.1 RNA polymerase sigma factor SigI [Planococcus sp. NCCP-2050]